MWDTPARRPCCTGLYSSASTVIPSQVCARWGFGGGGKMRSGWKSKKNPVLACEVAGKNKRNSGCFFDRLEKDDFRNLCLYNTFISSLIPALGALSPTSHKLKNYKKIGTKPLATQKFLSPLAILLLCHRSDHYQQLMPILLFMHSYMCTGTHS